MQQFNSFMLLCFLYGVLTAGSISVGYVLMSEQLPQSHRILTVSTDLAEPLVTLAICLYFWTLSKDWKYLILTSCVGLICMTTLILFYVFESPRYLITKGQRQKGFEVLKKIARKNGFDDQFEEFLKA